MLHVMYVHIQTNKITKFNGKIIYNLPDASYKTYDYFLFTIQKN